MGVTTVTHEYPLSGVSLPSSLPSNRPNSLPGHAEGIKSMDLVQGQWDTPGSIMKVTYSDGSYEKYKIGTCDAQNGCFKHTLVEGGVVGDKVDSVDVVIKIDHGSMKVNSSYNTKGTSKLTQGEVDAEESKAKLFCENVANFMKARTN